jgi:hypothetical protein
MRRVAGAMNRIGCRTVALVCYRPHTWRISFAKGNRWPGTTVAANGHIRQSQRAIEEIERYSRPYDDERMARYRLAILVAVRDGMEIPGSVAVPMANYFEDVASLTRSGHLDIKLLWLSFQIEAELWWVLLQAVVQRARARDGAAASRTRSGSSENSSRWIAEQAAAPPSTPNMSPTGWRVAWLNASKTGSGSSRNSAQSSSRRRTASILPNQRLLHQLQVHLPT